MTLCKYCIIYDMNYMTNQPLHHMDVKNIACRFIIIFPLVEGPSDKTPPVFKLVLTVNDTCSLSHLQSAIISPEGYTT